MELSLFPPTGLGGSVVTTVFVGTLICCFFNLRLGWSLQGMITPGYLAPLVLLRPFTAGAIVLEAMVAALFVWLLSNRLSRLDLWSRWFGRELFLLVLGTSVVVRIVFDAWLLPACSQWLSARYGIPVYQFDSLHSFGLIVVALLAYQLVRTGGVRGMMQVAVTTGLTIVALRWLLMPLTNFSLGEFRYLYEDLAYTLLGSPKSYIILLVVAFYASHVNLKYGWDFHGILVPAFIALQWYEPVRIVSSLAEAAIIYALGSAILRWPRVAAWPPEGARKIAIFMSVGFAYKWLLGWIAPLILPGVVVMDFYGFGYLITTLLAIKMQESGRPYFLSVALVQTSIIPVLLASLLGFGLQYFPGLWTTRATVERVDVRRARISVEEIPALLRSEDLNHRRFRLAEQRSVPLPRELESFRDALKWLKRYRGDESKLERARQRLASVGYEVVSADDRYLILRSLAGQDWGLFVIDRAARDAKVIAVPTADRFRVPEAAWALFQQQGAAGLAISARPAGREADHPDCFELFVQRFGADGVTIVTAKDPRRPKDTVRRLSAVIGLEEPNRKLAGQPVLARLELPPSLLRTLAVGPEPTPLSQSKFELRTRLVRELNASENIARRNSSGYRAPTLPERIWLEEMVIDPLLSLPAADDPARNETLLWVDQAARTLGYQIETGPDGWLLLRETAVERRHWGWFAFRNDGDDVLVSVPRPLTEARTLDVGLTLMEELDASALAVAAAHPDANRDGSANHLSLSHVGNAMNVVQQAWLRRAGKPALLAQVRGFGPDRASTKADVITALGGADISLAESGPRERQLAAAWQRLGLRERRLQGAPAEAGLEPGRQPMALFLRQAPEARFALLWFSPTARESLAGSLDNVPQQRALAALGAPTMQTDLAEFLAKREVLALPEPLRSVVRRDWKRFRNSGNINALRRAQLALPPDTQWMRVEDTRTHRAVLVAFDENDRLLLLAALDGAGPIREIESTAAEELVRQFQSQRADLGFIAAP